MKEIAFSELNIQPKVSAKEIFLHDKTIEVLDYLPIDEKARFLQFVVDGAIDEMTGTFSPLRIEVYFGIALCHWYAGIVFSEDDMQNVTMVYDALDTTGVIDVVVEAIPEEEIDFIRGLVMETTEDIARYYTSAAGIIQAMSNSASGLDSQITEILQQIKNGEGLEQLAVIKDVVGTG